MFINTLVKRDDPLIGFMITSNTSVICLIHCQVELGLLRRFQVQFLNSWNQYRTLTIIEMYVINFLRTWDKLLHFVHDHNDLKCNYLHGSLFQKTILTLISFKTLRFTRRPISKMALHMSLFNF